jgi:hypothetical protein
MLLESSTGQLNFLDHVLGERTRASRVKMGELSVLGDYWLFSKEVNRSVVR